MSIDLNYLEEYEIREIEAVQRNIPFSKRVDISRSPTCYIVDESSSFWSQVAFAGTVIFRLYPIPPDIFEKNWNISIDTLNDFLRFVKETKKIQFVLTTHPTHYAEFDYLEPILREFSPPVYTVNLDRMDEKIYETESTCLDEFNLLVSLSPEWQSWTSSVTGRNHLRTQRLQYTYLRYLGFDEFADTFIENFLIEPDFANAYISLVSKLILYPINDPLKSTLSISIDTLQDASQMGINTAGTTKRSSFPEIGSYLMKKCTYYPESLEACKNVISRYEENDLYKINSALNEAIVDKNDTLVRQKNDELSEIMDNIWADSTIKRNATLCNYGIDVTSGMIGYGLGGMPGLLGSMGLGILDKTKSKYLDQFSELIAKKTASPYMATIYDFKKKYPV
ncbi:MAG: hypothetical protein WC593_01870 [Methanoregula sp.]